MGNEFWGPFADRAAAPGPNLRLTGCYDEVPAALYDTIYPQRDDISEYEKMAAQTGGPILELGCGTGRVLLSLAAQGYSVVGVDNSAQMLAGLEQRLSAFGPEVAARVEYMLADAREVQLGRRFPVVL